MIKQLYLRESRQGQAPYCLVGSRRIFIFGRLWLLFGVVGECSLFPGSVGYVCCAFRCPAVLFHVVPRVRTEGEGTQSEGVLQSDISHEVAEGIADGYRLRHLFAPYLYRVAAAFDFRFGGIELLVGSRYLESFEQRGGREQSGGGIVEGYNRFVA